ncbi:HAD superfamily hydrolase (TIGR01549 family) [Cupriavidus metallidurans]|jgi:HAD superfamily hydrolase (TIGR01549 family)|uniref:HAD family hydrolase n=1 Tax=Cupriavidus metallidurans TaxID=119219 RepID=UPI00068D9FBF|nr:HAD-IA family hydrolase [Cupriavidus metallidurans]MDE4916305.1 HAD-IA family hydrolase [Cupriavidus metallidurans]
MSAIPSVPIQAVIFDAFDTLCEIGNPLHPFAEIARAGHHRIDARVALMTRPVGIRQAIEHFGITDLDVASLEKRLETELASIRLFDDTIPALTELKRRGIKLAIASNLAAPYAAPLLELLPFQLDAYAWSFDVGYLKPQAEIFEWTIEKLGVSAGATLMVGDTYKADYLGAEGAGLQARHLVRAEGPQPGVQSIRSLSEILGLQLAQ